MTTSRTPRQVERAAGTFGEYVMSWRKLQRLTAQDVCERADISRGTLRRIETGDPAVSFVNVLRVCRALGILDQLVASVDPFESDLGRLRAEDRLPERVRRQTS